MNLLTADLLAEIVTQLATAVRPLVKATQIIAHCKEHTIDMQGAGSSNYAAFWDADLGEAAAQHRLQKFKRGPTAQSRNAWCLSSGLAAGRIWATNNGWCLVPWSSTNGNWMFLQCGPSATTPTHI